MPIYYTYLIGWSKTNIYYYGVRYAKNAHPSDLFMTYYTSSKHVKHYTNKHGNPDIIQIRKTFNDSNLARAWEDKVLKRMNLKEHKSFLNASNNKAPKVAQFDRGANFSTWNSIPYKDKFTPEQRSLMAAEASKRAIQQHKDGVMNYQKPEDTTNYKTSALARWSNPLFKKKAKSRRWYYNDKELKSRMLLPEDVTSDWTLGRRTY